MIQLTKMAKKIFFLENLYYTILCELEKRICKFEEKKMNKKKMN